MPDTISVQVLPDGQAVFSLEKDTKVIFAEPELLGKLPSCERGVKTPVQGEEDVFCQGAGSIF